MSKPLTGEGGKGSVRRTANEQAYADNWDKIFGKKKPNPPTRKGDKPKDINEGEIDKS